MGSDPVFGGLQRKDRDYPTMGEEVTARAGLDRIVGRMGSAGRVDLRGSFRRGRSGPSCVRVLRRGGGGTGLGRRIPADPDVFSGCRFLRGMPRF